MSPFDDPAVSRLEADLRGTLDRLAQGLGRIAALTAPEAVTMPRVVFFCDDDTLARLHHFMRSAGFGNKSQSAAIRHLLHLALEAQEKPAATTGRSAR